MRRSLILLRRLMALACLTALATGGTPGEESAESPDQAVIAELLATVQESYGGREKLLAVSGYRAHGKILSAVSGVSGELQMAVEMNGSMRVDIHYPSRSEVRILKGRLAWSGGRRRQRPAKHQMAESMRLQYHRLATPFEMAGASPEDFELLGEGEQGWVRLRRRWNEALTTIYEVDRQTGLIHRVRGEIRSEDNQMSFTTDSFDFRTVDGLMFPFRMTTMVNDEVAAETILQRVKLVEEFESDTFVPAGARKDL